MKPIFAHFLKIEFSVIFWRLTKNSRNWFIFHAKIDRNCIFFWRKKSYNVSLNLPQFFCTKNVHCTKFQACPHFLPLYLMRLLFLICSQDENVQEYKRAKKSPGFPPSFSSQMSLWAAEGKSGVARRSSHAHRALYCSLWVLPKCDQSRSGAQNAE